MKRNKRLLALVMAVVLSLSTAITVFADEEAETTIEGTIQATLIEFTMPTTTTFTLNPSGATEAERFIAPDFTFSNDTNAPLKIEIADFALDALSPHTFIDVAPDARTDAEWGKSGRGVSENEIALALVATGDEGVEWRTKTLTDRVYVTEVADAKGLGQTIKVGEVDPHASVDFTLSAKHGNAFQSEITALYKISWIFSLA